MVRDRAGNSRLKSRRLTLSPVSKRYSDFVGTADANDYYRVEFKSRSSLDLKMVGQANVELLNARGRRIPGTLRRATSRDKAINLNLNTGVYYLRVYKGPRDTTYSLALTANPDRAGETTRRARKIRLRSTATNYVDYVGVSDANDYYSFTLSERREVSLALRGLRADANLQLRNGAGLIASSAKKGKSNESILRTLNPGTYYVRVLPAKRGISTRYTLTTSAKSVATSDELTQTWLKQFGTSANDYAYGIVTDPDGAVYTVGSTNGGLSGSNQGDRDSYITKYSSNGVSQWTKQLGGNNEDVFYGVAVDSQGSIYATGTQDATIAGITPVGKASLVKYDSSGNKTWDVYYDLNGAEAAAGIAIDQNDNIYIGGASATVSISLSGINVNSEGFLARYNTAGQKIWSIDAIPDITGDGAVTGVAVDQSGNVYVTGITAASAQANLDNPFNRGDAFVAKYNSQGEKQWFTVLASESASATDYARGIAVDGSGSVYITGETKGTFTDQTSKGGTDGFLAKFSTSTGDRQWVKQFGTSKDDQAQAIAVDRDGNIVIVGETFRTSGGSDSQAFLAKYDGTGSLLFEQQLGTSQADESYGVTVDEDNNVYISGQTQGSLAGSGSAKGGFDAWIAKYSPI